MPLPRPLHRFGQPKRNDGSNRRREKVREDDRHEQILANRRYAPLEHLAPIKFLTLENLDRQLIHIDDAAR